MTESYCLAIGSENSERRQAQREMMKVQPERQEEYGRDETEGTCVLGRADRDNGTEFAAGYDSDGGGVFGNGKDRTAVDANATRAKAGLAGDRQDWGNTTGDQ